MDIIKISDLPVNIIGYRPLELLTLKQITPTGMLYIQIDPSLRQETINKLLTSETELFEIRSQDQFKYLLEQHDEKQVYQEYFVAHHEIGKAHLSSLIGEDLNQTYAELTAAYCSDKKIPFLAALIILEDFRKVYGNLTFRYMQRGRLITGTWSPRETHLPPPINYRKMFLAKADSNQKIKDGYVLATVRDFCYNKSITAKVLNISTSALTTRLRNIGVLDAYGLIDRQKVIEILEDTSNYLETGYDPEKDQSPTPKQQKVMPPKARKSQETSFPQIPAKQLLQIYDKNKKNIKKTAEALNMPYVYIKSLIQQLTKQEDDIFEYAYDVPMQNDMTEVEIFNPKEEIEYIPGQAESET